MTTWTFGCDAWLFGDGTFTRIEVGKDLDASIEFWPVGRFDVVDPRAISVKSKGEDRYRVEARVIDVAEFITLDLGTLHVSCHAPPMSQSAELRTGDFINGTIGLGLNPYDWDKDAHPRRKRWLVESITQSIPATFVKRRSAKATSEQVSTIDSETVDHRASFLITCRPAAIE